MRLSKFIGGCKEFIRESYTSVTKIVLSLMKAGYFYLKLRIISLKVLKELFIAILFSMKAFPLNCLNSKDGNITH